jgi:hypothetical protein
MAYVPNKERAIVDLAKVSGYLLSRTHPIGRTKARFFSRFGFRDDAPDRLAQALMDHVSVTPVARTESSVHGTKYRLDGPLTSPDGRNPHVSSVWIIPAGDTIPRFVTAFPC